MSYTNTRTIRVEFALNIIMYEELRKIAKGRNATTGETLDALIEIYNKNPDYRKEVNKAVKPKAPEFKGFKLW